MSHITLLLSPVDEARLRQLAEERDARFETVAADALALGLSAHFLGRNLSDDPALGRRAAPARRIDGLTIIEEVRL